MKSEKPALSLQQMRDRVRGMAFNQLVGIRLVRVHQDGVTIDCKLRPELMNAHGVLHGGVTATMADAAVGIAITTRLGRPAATTVEMKLNYMRPVTSGKITARARILRMGSTLCVGRVDLFDDERQQVAAALVTYMLLK
ncbi:MAG TPA: PaaI family thioesterase [Bryobacteraceae bacterium]|nr:PaaI family thioesterase [Bryobacteraceae bacterium]